MKGERVVLIEDDRRFTKWSLDKSVSRLIGKEKSCQFNQKQTFKRAAVEEEAF